MGRQGREREDEQGLEAREKGVGERVRKARVRSGGS